VLFGSSCLYEDIEEHNFAVPMPERGNEQEMLVAQLEKLTGTKLAHKITLNRFLVCSWMLQFFLPVLTAFILNGLVGKVHPSHKL